MTQLPGLDQLRRAASILVDEGRPSDRRLGEALRAIYSASLSYKEWPDAVRQRADAIQPLLFRAGSLAETAEAADSAFVDELRGVLRSFLREVDRGGG